MPQISNIADTAPAPLTLSEEEAARAIPMCRKHFKAEVMRGKIRYVLIGKRRRYDPADLRAYLEEQKACLFIAEKTVRSGNTTLRSKVVGFEEALKRTTRQPQRQL